MEQELYNGAIDNQTPEQKALNYSFSEVCLTPTPVVWLEKTRDQYRSFPIRDQDGSGQCVCMTLATEMGILFKEKYGEWMDFSSSFPYQQRKYPETSGCTSEDIYTIFPKLGNIFEHDMPSQQMNDSETMAVAKKKYFDDLAKVYQVKRIALPIDFEVIAGTVQATGKGVMVWFKFHPTEWTNIPFVSDKAPTSGHSVTVVDYVLKGGKKYLVIQDSWGLKYADQGLRLISEEYFYERCYNAGYLMSFKTQDNETVFERPKFDGSIVSLQKCLKWEGLFPQNVPEIESFGNITRASLIKFQQRYNISPALGNFGPLTKQKLFELYK
jgi:hypothetical protein